MLCSKNECAQIFTFSEQHVYLKNVLLLLINADLRSKHKTVTEPETQVCKLYELDKVSSLENTPTLAFVASKTSLKKMASMIIIHCDSIADQSATKMFSIDTEQIQNRSIHC